MLRYFPADNGKNEAIAIIGNWEFIEGKIEECLDSL